MTENSNHDARGRFTKGNSAGIGRPKHAKDYMAAVKAAVPTGKWKQIIDQAVIDAIAGDRWARQWLSDYLLGKPTAHVEIQGNIGFSLADWQRREEERLGDIE